jgi:hypothetical protein
MLERDDGQRQRYHKRETIEVDLLHTLFELHRLLIGWYYHPFFTFVVDCQDVERVCGNAFEV